MYYYALIAELCKLSPTTVGPAVGKSIRKLYKLLGEDEEDDKGPGVDVEVVRRFTEWFAVHMSNFGFNWVWKEWYVRLSSLHGCHSQYPFDFTGYLTLPYHQTIRDGSLSDAPWS